jgi:acyl-CoA thioesterase FadM
MEQAEHALFRALGTSIFPADLHDPRFQTAHTQDPPFTWPRVRCECEYLAAVRFEEMIEMRVVVERLGVKSLTYFHEMQVADRLVARGRITAVCSRHVQGKLVGYPIPAAMRESLSRYLVPTIQTSS